MKKLKKAVVLAVLTVVMAFAGSKNVDAALVNTPENLVWGKDYSVDFAQSYGDDLQYQNNMNLQKSGKANFMINTSGDYIELYIYDSSEEEVCKRSLEKGLNNVSIDLLAGNYIVEIRKDKYTYERSVSFVPTFTPSGETASEGYMNKNNQVGTASPYTVGTTVKAHLAKNDDTDIYKMSVSKAGYLTMNFNSNMTKFDMQMVSEDGETSYNESGIPLGASSYKYFVPKGTYYISFVQDYKDYTGTYTFSTKLSGITVTKVKSEKNLKGRKAKITWVKKSDVDGYQVQVAQNKKFTKGKKTITITNKNTKSYTFTKLKKNKTYYARVCTYKLVGGKKIYSDWSVPKKFKVKK